MTQKNVIPLIFFLFLILIPYLFAETSFQFMVVADPQFGMIDRDGSEDFRHERARLQMALLAANHKKPEFILFAGDNINHPTNEAEFSALQETIQILDDDIALYYAAGNHDHYPVKNQLDWYRDNFGKDVYAFAYGEVFFLVLNSNFMKYPEYFQEENTRQYDLAKNHLQGVDSEKYRYRIIFQHHPFFINEADEEHNWRNLPREQREKYLTLYEENDVDFVFTGHMHSWVKNQWKGVEIITVPAVSNPLGLEPPGFLWVEVTPQQIAYQYFELSEALRKWNVPLKTQDLPSAGREYLETSLIRLEILREPVGGTDAESFHLQISLTNPFSEPLHLQLNSQNLSCPGEMEFSIEAKNSLQFRQSSCSEHHLSAGGHEFSMEGELKAGKDYRHPVEYLLYLPPQWKISPITEEDKTGFPVMENAAEFYYDRPEFLQLKAREQWTEKDLSALKKAAYCQDFLYLYFEVEDNIHHNPYMGDEIWEGDSLQIAMYFTPGEETLYFRDVLEFAVALTGEGMELALYSPSHFNREEIAEKIDHTIVRERSKTYYALIIPRNILGEGNRQKDIISFSFVINDNDGKGFDGGMAGGRGIYGIKNPGYFGELHLQ